MLDRIKGFFSVVGTEEVVDEAALHLAAAVLLIQVAKSDHKVEADEIARIKRVLQRDWDIDDGDLADLVKVADDTAERDVSLYAQVDLINRHFSPARKQALVRGLWQVACADGHIHPYEELLVRRLADLIYVSHTDFIRAKHLALDAG